MPAMHGHDGPRFPCSRRNRLRNRKLLSALDDDFRLACLVATDPTVQRELGPDLLVRQVCAHGEALRRAHGAQRREGVRVGRLWAGRGEARAARQSAEAELAGIEQKLKDALLAAAQAD